MKNSKVRSKLPMGFGAFIVIMLIISSLSIVGMMKRSKLKP